MRKRAFMVIAVTSLLIISSAGLGAIKLKSNESDTSTGVDSEANDVYSLTNYTILNATDDAFRDAFPDHELYVVREDIQIPEIPHAMAFNPTTDEGFDLTADFNDLLADAAILIESEEKAITVAEAFAQTGNVEFQLVRDVINATDSERLNMTIEDPSARTLIGGYEVELTTWSPENGIVANWTIKLTSTDLTRVSWEVVAVDKGNHTGGFEATNFRVGTELVNEWEDGSHQLYATQETDNGTKELDPEPGAPTATGWSTIETATNFDGSTWEIRYPSFDPPPDVERLADALAKAGPFVYNSQVEQNAVQDSDCSSQSNPDENWGFESPDPDCTLVVKIRPNDLTALFITDRGADAHFFVSRHVKETMNAFGWYVNPAKHDLENISKTMLGHAHLHNIQYGLYQWGDDLSPSGAVTDGTARFGQTVLVPEVEHDPSSLFYGTSTGAASIGSPGSVIGPLGSGVNLFQLWPSRDACNQDGGYAHFWGLLYWLDGGIDTIREVLQAYNPEDHLSCEGGMRGAVDNVLASPPDAHEGVDDAERDFGVHASTRNFTWEGKDWGAYMSPVYRRNAPYPDTTYQQDIGALGHHYIEIEVTGNVTLDCNNVPNIRVLLTDASGMSSRLLDCGTPITVDTTQYAEVTTHAYNPDLFEHPYKLEVS